VNLSIAFGIIDVKHGTVCFDVKFLSAKKCLFLNGYIYTINFQSEFRVSI